MDKSNLQRMLGASSATCFIATLQILGRAEPLPVSLRIAVWCFSLSIPYQAAVFAGDTGWFQRVFVDHPREWPRALLTISGIVSTFGLSCVFFYFGAIYGVTFLLVSVACIYGMGKLDDLPETTDT